MCKIVQNSATISTTTGENLQKSLKLANVPESKDYHLIVKIKVFYLTTKGYVLFWNSYRWVDVGLCDFPTLWVTQSNQTNLLKASCHILFMHMLHALHLIFKELTLFVYGLYRVCLGFRFTAWDDYFRVDFGHLLGQ